MNLNFLIKKNHIFKRRTHNCYKVKNTQTTNGIYSQNKFRFDFVLMRLIKKLFRRKPYKANNVIKNTKYWVMVKPNFILSMKSKNSRMGAGVGLFVRACSIIKPNKPLILLKNYSYFFVKNIIKFFQLKWNLTFYIIYNKLKIVNFV